MIASYFKWGSYLKRVLSTPVGPHLSTLAEELQSQGFSYWVLRGRLKGAAHFSAWTQRQERSIECLHEDMLDGFETHLRRCQCAAPLRATRHHDDIPKSGVTIAFGSRLDRFQLVHLSKDVVRQRLDH